MIIQVYSKRDSYFTLFCKEETSADDLTYQFEDVKRTIDVTKGLFSLAVTFGDLCDFKLLDSEHWLNSIVFISVARNSYFLSNT